MLVATFNATTGWAGRQITWMDEQFILDGHGAVTAADVMGYDALGQLDWPSGEMRSWAAARLSWEEAVRAAAVPAQPTEPAEAGAAFGGSAAQPTEPAAAGAVFGGSAAQPAGSEPAYSPTEAGPLLTPPAAGSTGTIGATAPVGPVDAPDEPEPTMSEAAGESDIAPAAEATVTDEPAADAPATDAPASDAPALAPVGVEHVGEEPVEAAAQAAASDDAAAAAEPAAQTADGIRDVLAPGGDIQEVVGSAPFQEALGAIIGAQSGTTADVEKWAHLIPEPDNPWDRYAVAVYIDGRKIGYLPRETSAAYASILGRLWTDSRGRAVCRAVVSGGWLRVQSQVGSVTTVDEGQIGVRLALAAPQRFEQTTALPRLTAEELANGPEPI